MIYLDAYTTGAPVAQYMPEEQVMPIIHVPAAPEDTVAINMAYGAYDTVSMHMQDQWATNMDFMQNIGLVYNLYG